MKMSLSTLQAICLGLLCNLIKIRSEIVLLQAEEKPEHIL